MEFSKPLNSFKTHVFYYDLYDQSDELTSLGNKLVIAGALVSGIMLLQCNIWYVALWLGNN